MKKILSIIACTFFLLQVNAQVKVDRSRKPKAGPAPIITFKDPATFTLANGMTILVVEDHKLPKVSASLTIDAGPITEGDKAGVIGLMGQMMGEGTTTMDKATFDEASEYLGASVGLSAGGGFASSLTRYFDQVFALMADGLKNPAFPQASLDKLKQQTITGLKNAEKSAATISSRVVNALNYGKTSPMGEFETAETVGSITLDDIKKAYKSYITPSRSYLTFVGDITPAKAKALADKYFASWKGTKLELPLIADVQNPGTAEIDFIDMPTAVQAQLSVGNLVNNPMNNKDYFALLLANQILGGGAESKLFMNLREKHGFTYGSYSNVGSGRFQSMFSAGAAVRTDKADSAVAEMVNEIIAMRNGDMTQEQLNTAKAKYNGSFALGMENPGRSATYASNILINNLPKDFYRTYLQKINAVTLEDIARVSKNYFNHTNSRIVLVGNGSKILPNLQRLGYPIKQYDIYANPVVEKTKETNVNETNATTDKVSANDILQSFYKASGGKENMQKVKSAKYEFTMDLMGQSATGVRMQMTPNKESQSIMLGGMNVYKEVFDGTKGYKGQMGQKADYSAADITDAKADAGIFPELNYISGGGYVTEYIGGGKVDNENTYRLKVVAPGGKTTIKQYSTKTGLLLQSESTANIQGQDVSIVSTYSDYRKTGDVMLPYNLVQNTAGQVFDIKISSIKLNEGVTEADFK